MAVLGFGDRSFPAFCAFACAVDNVARDKGWPALMAFDTIDRQSPQDFARWGRILGQALGIELELAHQPTLPAIQTLTLLERHDYGAAVQAPMSILRLALPARRSPAPDGPTLHAIRARRPAGHRTRRLGDPPPFPGIGSRDGFTKSTCAHVGGLTRPTDQLSQADGPGIGGAIRVSCGLIDTPDPDRGTGVGPLAGFIRTTSHTARSPVLRRASLTAIFYRTSCRLAGRWQAGSSVHRSPTRERLQYGRMPCDSKRHGSRRPSAGRQDHGVRRAGVARGVADALTDILKPAGLTPAMPGRGTASKTF